MNNFYLTLTSHQLASNNYYTYTYTHPRARSHQRNNSLHNIPRSSSSCPYPIKYITATSLSTIYGKVVGRSLREKVRGTEQASRACASLFRSSAPASQIDNNVPSSHPYTHAHTHRQPQPEYTQQIYKIRCAAARVRER